MFTHVFSSSGSSQTSNSQKKFARQQFVDDAANAETRCEKRAAVHPHRPATIGLTKMDELSGDSNMSGSSHRQSAVRPIPPLGTNACKWMCDSC